MRLRLAELRDLSEANRDGAVRVNGVVEKLLNEVKALLESEDPYLAKRYPEIAGYASKLKHTSTKGFVPGALGPGLLKAFLDHLDQPEYVQGLVAHLAAVVDSAGHSQVDFRRLDDLVCQLDAELVYNRHSRSWREAVLAEVEVRYAKDGSLANAILDTLDAHHHGRVREFVVLTPLTDLSEESNTARLRGIQVQPAIEIIREWAPENADEVLKTVSAAQAVSHFPNVEAADPDAAVRIVDKQLRSAVGAWRLMGRKVADPTVAVVYDTHTTKTHVLELPSEPLEVRPPGVEQWRPGEDDPSGRLNDALDQLAQARTAPPQTAFVDLWTAADALYGGVADDPGWHAGDVMAGLGQFVYARDVHLWLAGRAEAAGLGAAPEGGEVEWIVSQLTSDAPGLDKALADAGDAIGWARFKLITAWDGGSGLRNDFDRLVNRLVSVCDRAYLIRNFAVHRAEVRGPALEIVLPAFAGLVAAAVGHSLAAKTDDTLADALAAGLTARSVAYDFKAKRSKAPDGLEPMLSA
ncbi:MAG: hypothetical protein GXY03_02590 [Solirubrobacterales bacterium]|nr:hypothetical protein [Solirubrobacterales bacterium]